MGKMGELYIEMLASGMIPTNDTHADDTYWELKEKTDSIISEIESGLESGELTIHHLSENGFLVISENENEDEDKTFMILPYEDNEDNPWFVSIEDTIYPLSDEQNTKLGMIIENYLF